MHAKFIDYLAYKCSEAVGNTNKVTLNYLSEKVSYYSTYLLFSTSFASIKKTQPLFVKNTSFRELHGSVGCGRGKWKHFRHLDIITMSGFEIHRQIGNIFEHSLR